jgi:hypothetical protein
VLGKAAGLLLGEDELAVAHDVELPFAAGDVSCGDAVCFQLGHETRGPLVVARSGRAVVDLDSHGREPTFRVAAEVAFKLYELDRSGGAAGSRSSAVAELGNSHDSRLPGRAIGIRGRGRRAPGCHLELAVLVGPVLILFSRLKGVPEGVRGDVAAEIDAGGA